MTWQDGVMCILSRQPANSDTHLPMDGPPTQALPTILCTQALTTILLPDLPHPVLASSSPCMGQDAALVCGHYEEGPGFGSWPSADTVLEQALQALRPALE